MDIPEAAGFLQATLIDHAWLRRILEVETPEGRYTVEYNGRGIGYETVRVDGWIVSESSSWFWFVPRFRFRLGELPASIEVRVWPWLTLRRFELWVDGELLYAE